jgi:hypothetical protein
LKISAQDYLDAAGSRIRSAEILQTNRRYSAAIYFAGVAVECVLRAYVVRQDPEFDARHDLQELLRQSQLGALTRGKHYRQANAWLGEVWARWKNDYRYASDERLRSEFRRCRLNYGIKGDFLKENCRRMLEAALQLHAIGAERWRSKQT